MWHFCFWKQDISFLNQTQLSYGSKGESFDSWGEKTLKWCRGERQPARLGKAIITTSGPAGQGAAAPLRCLQSSLQRSQAQGLWGRSHRLELYLHPIPFSICFPSTVSALLSSKGVGNRTLCHSQFLKLGYPSFMCFFPLYLFFGDTASWVLCSSITKQYLLLSLLMLC